jgi:hypothetical protein
MVRGGATGAGKGDPKGSGPTLSLSHDHIDGRIELSLDVGGSALLGEPVDVSNGAGQDGPDDDARTLGPYEGLDGLGLAALTGTSRVLGPRPVDYPDAK